MSIRYFFKGILSQNVVKDRAGRNIPWERLAGNQGLIALDPATANELIEDLAKIVGTRGVIEINLEKYQAIKKKSLSITSPKRDSGLPPVRVHQNDLSLKKRAVQSAEPTSAVSPPPPENTVPAGGDKQLAAASVPTKPVPRLGHARPIRFQGDPVPVVTAPEAASDVAVNVVARPDGPTAAEVMTAMVTVAEAVAPAASQVPAEVVIAQPVVEAPAAAPAFEETIAQRAIGGVARVALDPMSDSSPKVSSAPAPAAPKRRGRPPKKAAEPVMA